MLWVTADQHFGHKNIIKYENRPFDSVKDMNNTIINNFNALVDKSDITYHLGDFALTPKRIAKELLAELNGRHKIILGNHDRGPVACKDIGFEDVYRTHHIIETETGGIVMAHRRIVDLPTLNVGVDNFNFYPIPIPTTRGWFSLCGHSHGNWLVSESGYIVSSETNELFRKIEERYRMEQDD